MKVVDDVVEEMEADGWVPDNPDDNGAFGKSVHDNVTERMRGRSNWAMDVIVDGQTREVLGIDGVGVGGGQGRSQVDAIALEKGYNLKVGDTIDPDRIFLCEIKNSIKGSPLTAQQLEKLKFVSGGREIGLVRSSRVYVAGQWKDVPKLKTSVRILGLVGAAGAIHAMINIDVYEDQRLALVDAIHEAREAEPGPQKRLAAGGAVIKMQQYLANFLPEHESLNIVTYRTLLKLMTE